MFKKTAKIWRTISVCAFTIGTERVVWGIDTTDIRVAALIHRASNAIVADQLILGVLWGDYATDIRVADTISMIAKSTTEANARTLTTLTISSAVVGCARVAILALGVVVIGERAASTISIERRTNSVCACALGAERINCGVDTASIWVAAINCAWNVIVAVALLQDATIQLATTSLVIVNETSVAIAA
jgi:hypothetical protein